MFTIESGDGTTISEGFQSRSAARAAAQRVADRTGETVYVQCVDAPGTFGEPEPDEPEAIAPGGDAD